MQIELKELLTLFSPSQAAQQPMEDHGDAIVVMDAGFVYQGKVTTDGTFCHITNATNIRVWGTKNGLGELALKGPQTDTKLDNCGSLKSPVGRVISIMPCKTSNW